MPRRNLKELFEKITAMGFTQAAGFTLREFEQGRVVLDMAPREDLSQFSGFVHAGVVAGLADHAAGAAYTSTLPDGKACVTIELKINFLKPAQGGRLAAEAKVVSAGGTIGVVHVDVHGEKDGARTLCATALITLRAVTWG